MQSKEVNLLLSHTVGRPTTTSGRYKSTSMRYMHTITIMLPGIAIIIDASVI